MAMLDVAMILMSSAPRRLLAQRRNTEAKAAIAISMRTNGAFVAKDAHLIMSAASNIRQQTAAVDADRPPPT
jgi:hypothetical protein